MSIITGLGPLNLLGGRYRNPLMERSSQLFQWISSGSENFVVSRPPVSLNVQRSSLLVEVSSEYTSEEERADSRLKANSWLRRRHRRPLRIPFGRLGTACPTLRGTS